MKWIQTVIRSQNGTEYVYDHKGYTVVLVHPKMSPWYAYVITGTVGDPYDREVDGEFSSKKEAKQAAEKMIDKEIEAEIEWERRNGIYIDDEESLS